MDDFTLPIAARFWSHVEKTDTCWLWTAYLNQGGYGRFTINRKPDKPHQWRAHRYAYELMVGPIPFGLQLDHLCFNRRCVNPAHLEPVTNRINSIRALSRSAAMVCQRGHPLTDGNLYLRPDGHSRQCIACINIRRRNYAKRATIRRRELRRRH